MKTSIKLISNTETTATVEINGSVKERKLHIRGNTSYVLFKGEEFSIADMKGAPEAPAFHINERFEMLENFVKMTINGLMNSTLITGQGGLGKSYTVLQELDRANLQEDEDYVIIKGYSTPKALYATLYENRHKLVIFDDCDSVLKDPIALNILKGALDTYDKRTISWNTRGFIEDELPASFDFCGQVIFISNMNISKVDKAVKSRAIAVDVSMNNSEKIDRIEAIAPAILPEYNMIIKEKVLNFVREFIDMSDSFNIRTFQTMLKIHDQYNGQGWETPAKYVMINS